MLPLQKWSLRLFSALCFLSFAVAVSSICALTHNLRPPTRTQRRQRGRCLFLRDDENYKTWAHTGVRTSPRGDMSVASRFRHYSEPFTPADNHRPRRTTTPLFWSWLDRGAETQRGSVPRSETALVVQWIDLSRRISPISACIVPFFWCWQLHDCRTKMAGQSRQASRRFSPKPTLWAR